MIRVNIHLKPEVHKRVKIISALKNEKMYNYLQDAIKKAVEKDKALIEELIK